MTEEAGQNNKVLSVGPKSGSALIVRSEVPPGKPYGAYKKYLRRDFVYSCAYCTMSEAEAQAIRLTIDHYEPRKSRPDLENSYGNLMYACDECNQRKGDRCPPPEARANGIRFFRPDQDYRSDHFERTGLLLKEKSALGNYSIAALDLNRTSLRRLRDIRERLTRSAELASEGIMGLKNLRYDQLPQAVRGRAVRAMRDAERAEKKIIGNIDSLLAEYARSPLLDSDGDTEIPDQTRLKELKSIESLHAGNWRAPRAKKV